MDGHHVEEELHYLVLEAGVHELTGSKKVEVGKVQTNHNFTSVSFSAGFSEPPVILSQSQTRFGGHAIVTRQTNEIAFGFSVKVEEEEGSDDWHAVEDVGYVAIEQHD